MLASIHWLNSPAFHHPGFRIKVDKPWSNKQLQLLALDWTLDKQIDFIRTLYKSICVAIKVKKFESELDGKERL